jgi:hypothetical protein
LRYLKNLLGAFLISIGGYIFGFNIAPAPPTLPNCQILPLLGVRSKKAPGKGSALEKPSGTDGNLEKPPDEGGGRLGVDEGGCSKFSDDNFVKNSGWFLIIKSKSMFIGSIFSLGLVGLYIFKIEKY